MQAHYIQVRLSREDGLGVPNRIVSIDDDGTIHLADGTSRWHHDPVRLRAVVARCGAAVFLGSHGVLRVPSRDNSSYCFSINDVVVPCRPETAQVRPGESLLDELLRRGGFVRSGRSALAELAATHALPEQPPSRRPPRHGDLTSPPVP